MSLTNYVVAPVVKKPSSVQDREEYIEDDEHDEPDDDGDDDDEDDVIEILKEEPAKTKNTFEEGTAKETISESVKNLIFEPKLVRWSYSVRRTCSSVP